MTTMDLNDVRRTVQEARDQTRTPNLYRADLSGADLRGADLYGADLSCANLRGANLRKADLYGAALYGADLQGTNLCKAELYGADLYGANLRGADLRNANLYGANLQRANLYGADLEAADLRWVAGWKGLQITGLHRYQILLTPTHEAWSITIGCWTGTPDELDTLIAQDHDWPESTGEQITRNRALLEAALVMIRAHIAAHPEAVAKAAEAHATWTNKENQQ